MLVIIFLNPRMFSIMKMTTNSILMVMLQIFPSEVGCFGQLDVAEVIEKS